MDHFRQIPQVGRAFDDFLESCTTLAYLAAVTDRVRLGTLVSGVTYRNVAHLGKIVATLDVLSGGRAVCGLGLAWFKAEHTAYGWPFPPVTERYDLLEDALRLLPLLWGPGSKPFEGAVLRVPETMCYPRPLQERVPLLVGGGGERRTLRLAARYADAANVFGDAGHGAAQGGRARGTLVEPTDLGRLTAESASGFQSAIERGGLQLVVRYEDAVSRSSSIARCGRRSSSTSSRTPSSSPTRARSRWALRRAGGAVRS